MVCALALCASLLPAGALANNTDGIDVDASSSSQVVTGTEPTEEEQSEETASETEQPAEAEVSTQSVEPTNETEGEEDRLAAARASGPDTTDQQKSNDFITLYYNDPVTDYGKSALTVKIQDEAGTPLCDDLTIDNVMYLPTTMRVSISESKYASYEIVSVEAQNSGEMIELPGSLNDAQNRTFTYSADRHSTDAILLVTLKKSENQNVINLQDKNGNTFGSITYVTDVEAPQKTNVHIYLNNEYITTVKNLSIPNTVAATGTQNFVMALNDGYYFAPYVVGVTHNFCTGSTIDEQSINLHKDTRNDRYSYLTFGRPKAEGTNELTLDFYTYNEGFLADFTRYVNGDLVNLGNIDDSCKTLTIRYSYNGTNVEMTYDGWNQTHTVFLPKNTDVYVTPNIEQGYEFVFWRTYDAWTSGIDLYSVMPDGSLQNEVTGLYDEQKGLVALSETMVMRYDADGFPRAQIGLHMTDGERPNMYNEVYYNSNYPSEVDKVAETDTQYFYPTMDTGTRLKDCMFMVEGYTFKGWNTKADGSGTAYEPGDYFHSDLGEDLTLYAQWEKVGTGEPEIPHKPTDEELDDLLDVEVTCQNNSNHSKDFDELLDDSYKISTPTMGKENYECTVTIKADSYIKQMAGDHKIVDGTPDSKKVLLAYVNDQWIVANEAEATVSFLAECVAPEAPDNITVAGLLKDVTVTCDEHNSKTYDIDDTTITVDKSSLRYDENNEAFIVEVSVAAQNYVDQYIGDFGPHTLNDNESKTVTLLYQNGSWVLANKDAKVEFKVKCDTPDKPEYDEIAGLLGGVTVTCDVHGTGTYKLSDGNYEVGGIQGGGYGALVKVTVFGAAYVDKFEADHNNIAHKLVGSEQITISLVYQKDGWMIDSSDLGKTIAFQVTCKPDAPTTDEVDNLKIKNAVTLDCINTSVNHADVTYDLLKDSIITIGEVYGGTGGESYKVNLTIGPAYYVREYDMSMGTTHTWNGSDTGTITLSWDAVNNTWTAEAFDPIVFQVKCSTVTVPGDGGNNNDTPKDEHPDIAEGIANGTWGGTPTPTPAASATSTIPQTSDSMPIGLLAGTAAIAAAAIALLLVLRKRRQQ